MRLLRKFCTPSLFSCSEYVFVSLAVFAEKYSMKALSASLGIVFDFFSGWVGHAQMATNCLSDLLKVLLVVVV